MRKLCNCFVWSCANTPCRGAPGAAPTSLWSGVMVKPQPHIRKYTFECGVVCVQVRKGYTAVSPLPQSPNKEANGIPKWSGTTSAELMWSWAKQHWSCVSCSKACAGRKLSFQEGSTYLERSALFLKNCLLPRHQGQRMAVTPRPWLTLPWVSFLELKSSSLGMGEKITRRWAEAETKTKSLCLLPLSGTQRRCSGGWGLPLVKNTSPSFCQCGGDPTLYLDSRNVVLSWDSRKALLRCRADVCEVLLGQHTANPFLDHDELPSFGPMAAALPSNRGMNPLAL